MAEGRKLGAVWIEVTADASTIGRKLRPQVEAAARDAGDSLHDELEHSAEVTGADIARTLSDAVADGIQRGLKDAWPKNNPTEEPATRQGLESGGAFADGFSARVRAALADLPPARIGAATDEAEQKLRDLRVRMQELSDKRIGVDLSADEALTELAALRAQLDEVGAASADPQVRADTAAASAELAKVQAQLDHLDGQTANATVDVDDKGSAAKAEGGIGGLAAKVMTLVPLFAAGGVAAIGLGGAVVAAGSVAVAALAPVGIAIAGVVKAMTLMGQADDAVLQNSVKAATGQAASAAAIASAEASLTNTRLNAAAAAVKAAESVANAKAAEVRAERDAAANIADAETALATTRTKTARDRVAATRAVAAAQATATSSVASALARQQSAERTLEHAQRSEQQAQEDLTGARKDAQQQLEDLTSSMAGNSLDQRQVVLDVAQAQRDLDTAKADPTADQAARAQAQLTYDQAIQRQKDLATTGDRLAAQQADAQAKGVEGSDLVTAAEQRVTAAIEARGNATTAAAAAAAAVQTARVTGANNIALAEERLGQVQTDTAAAVLAAQANLDDARTAGAEKVATAQQKVADSTRDQAEQARGAAFSLSQAQAGVTAAMAGTGAAGVAALAGIQAQLDLLDPATRNFATYLHDTWGPVWEDVQATVAGAVLPGIKGGLDALLPIMPQITGQFAALGTTAGVSLGTLLTGLGTQLVPLLTTINTAAGPVFDALGTMVLAILPVVDQLVTAFAPLVPVALQVVTVLVTALGDLLAQLAPVAEVMLDQLLVAFQMLAPVLGVLGQAIIAIATAFAPLLPILVQVIGAALQPLTAIIVMLAPLLGALAAQVGTMLVGALTSLAPILLQLATMLFPAVKQVIAALAPLLPVLVGAFLSLLAAVLPLVPVLIDLLLTILLPLLPVIVDLATTALPPLLEAFSGLVTAVMPLLDVLGTLIGWLMPVLIPAIMMLADSFTGALTGAVNGITNIIKGALAIVLGVWTVFKGIFTGDWAMVWDGIKQTFAGVWLLIKGIFETAWNVWILGTFASGLGWVKDIFSVGWAAVKGIFTNPIIAVKEFLEAFLSGEGAGSLRSVFRSIVDWLTGTFSKLWAGIRKIFTDPVDAVKTALSGVFGEGGFLRTLFSDAVNAIGHIWDGVKALMKAPIDFYVNTVLNKGLIGGFNWITSKLNIPLAVSLIPWPPDGWATGGYTGNGGKYDPAGVVHRGEFVMDSERTSRLRPLLETLHGTPLSRLPEYHTGGLVDPLTGSSEIGGPLDWVKDKVGDVAGFVQDVASWVADPVDSLVKLMTNALGDAARGPMGDMLLGSVKSVGTTVGNALLSAIGAGGSGGGDAGDTPIGGGWQSIWNLVHAAIPQARQNSTYRAGDPGYHGKGKAIDFGFGSGPGGNGSPGLASIARFLYTHVGSTLAELIYDGAYDDTPDVKNGRDHTYNDQTRRDHQHHVHGAVYDDGGWLPPGGSGINLSVSPEPVFTAAQWRTLEANLAPVLAGVGGPAVAGQTVYVTYAPALHVPTVPTAAEAAAVLEQDLVRSLQLGLTSARIGEVR